MNGGVAKVEGINITACFDHDLEYGGRSSSYGTEK
jgi:hypothetical protein